MAAISNQFLRLSLFATIIMAGHFHRANAAAATTVNSSLDDVILSIQVSGGEGQGATSNLEIDLGRNNQFYQPTPGVLQLVGLQVADLIDTFGANWNLRTDLFWSVMATTGSAVGTTVTVSGNGTAIAAKTIWASEAESTAGTKSTTPWARKSGSAQQTPISLIAGLYANAQPGGNGGLNGQTSTTNRATAVVMSSANPNSFTGESGANGAGTFNYFTSGGSPQNTTAISSGSVVASDFYELQPSTVFGTPGTFIGAFALTSAGVFEFSSNAANFGTLITVPEPSSTAAIFGLIALGGVCYRRSSLRSRSGQPRVSR